MQVSKWGNSLAVRLPASVVEALELKEGDDIEIHAAGARAFVVSRTRSDVLWSEDHQHGAVLEGVRVSNPFLRAQP
jgi:antitoxin component of MazEF toxin-antitoxin module